MLARVGVDLGAVQRDVAELEQLHLARQHQHLHEQRLHFLQEAAAEGGQRVVIGVGVGRHVAKRHRVVGRALDLAAGVHAVGVAVDQQAQQHRRVVRRRASARVLPHQIAQIKLLDDFDHEARQVTTGQPFVHRRRQQVRGVSVNGHEAAHLQCSFLVMPPRLSLSTSAFGTLESPTAS